MRRICVMAAICLTILFQSSAIGETELFFEGSDKNSAAYQKFVKSHPECIVNTETNIYRSTNEIISALLTGEFPYDTFVMTTTSFDIKKLMDKVLHFIVILGTMHIVQTHGRRPALRKRMCQLPLQSCWTFLKHGWSAL